MWRCVGLVRRERTVAPRRAGTKGKGSIRPLCSGGGAIAHNGRWFMPVQPLEKTNEPHGLAQLGGVSGENENF